MGLDLTTAQAAWHPLLEISNVVRETTPATVQCPWIARTCATRTATATRAG